MTSWIYINSYTKRGWEGKRVWDRAGARRKQNKKVFFHVIFVCAIAAKQISKILL
jgi:hypothetical protein